MIATLNPEIARSGPIYRPAQLALLRYQLMQHFESTDSAARQVEDELAKLSKATAIVSASAPHLNRAGHPKQLPQMSR